MPWCKLQFVIFRYSAFYRMATLPDNVALIIISSCFPIFPSWKLEKLHPYPGKICHSKCIYINSTEGLLGWRRHVNIFFYCSCSSPHSQRRTLKITNCFFKDSNKISDALWLNMWLYCMLNIVCPLPPTGLCNDALSVGEQPPASILPELTRCLAEHGRRPFRNQLLSLTQPHLSPESKETRSGRRKRRRRRREEKNKESGE